MPPSSIIVRAEWDPEAGVYVALSDDVPGLVAEAETPQALMEKLQILVPELLELNGGIASGDSGEMRDVPLYVMHQHTARIRLPA